MQNPDIQRYSKVTMCARDRGTFILQTYVPGYFLLAVFFFFCVTVFVVPPNPLCTSILKDGATTKKCRRRHRELCSDFINCVFFREFPFICGSVSIFSLVIDVCVRHIHLSSFLLSPPIYFLVASSTAPSIESRRYRTLPRGLGYFMCTR